MIFQSSRNLPLPGSQPRNKGEWVELTRDFTQSLGGFVRSSQSDVMSCPEPSLILHGHEHGNCKFNRLWNHQEFFDRYNFFTEVISETGIGFFKRKNFGGLVAL